MSPWHDQICFSVSQKRAPTVTMRRLRRRSKRLLQRDWDRMVTFYDFPKEHWGHLRTTNPVESPFAALRLRTDAAKRYKRVDRAIAVIWKMLMVAEQRFRRLKAPELIEDVYLGAQYADGHRTSSLWTPCIREQRSPPPCSRRSGPPSPPVLPPSPSQDQP